MVSDNTREGSAENSKTHKTCPPIQFSLKAARRKRKSTENKYS